MQPNVNPQNTGASDPCLFDRTCPHTGLIIAGLRSYADEYHTAISICRRHLAGEGHIRVHGQSGGHAWECEGRKANGARCGRLMFSPHARPPRACPDCGGNSWSAIVPMIPTNQDGAEIAAEDFYHGFYWWVRRTWGPWGRIAVQFVLCPAMEERHRRICGDCRSCPERARLATIAATRKAYEVDRAMIQRGGLTNHCAGAKLPLDVDRCVR